MVLLACNCLQLHRQPTLKMHRKGSAHGRHLAVELDTVHWQSMCCAACPPCSGLDSNALQACPCTSEALCKADTTGKFRSDCSWNSNTPGYWYFGHGGEPDNTSETFSPHRCGAAVSPSAQLGCFCVWCTRCSFAYA